MLNKVKIEDIPKITVSSSLTVTNSYSHTTTTVTSGEVKNEETKKKPDKELDKNDNETSVTPPDAKNITPFTNKSLAGLSDMNTKLVIAVTKTGEIYGTENETVPTYITKSKDRRGNVLLINNIEFQKKEYFRAGAEVDQENITKLFRDMGFTIEDHINKTKEDMEKIIANYCADSSLITADINITIIMSHGKGDYSNTYIETVDNDCVEIKWILEQFSNSKCEYLADKPKIFIFQCCRGSSSDIQVHSGVFQTPTAAEDSSDMLLAFATVPGYVSHRDTKLGTWYIQSICKIFMEHAHNIHVEDLLKIVDKNLKNMNLTRQTSSYENRGFKRCYLNPI